MTDEEQLEQFIDKYSPDIGALARAALRRMRHRLPGAVELVYDNYNALVIGFGPNAQALQATFSIALYPRWVNLFFLQGASLPDPQRILKGSGSRVRSIRLQSAEDIDAPAVQQLIAEALRHTPIDGSRPRRLIIKSVSAKQRARKAGPRPRPA
jgi:hypothetical protein